MDPLIDDAAFDAIHARASKALSEMQVAHKLAQYWHGKHEAAASPSGRNA